MSKKQNDKETEKAQGIPWLPGFKRPNIDFRIPEIELPYEAPHKYLLAITLFAVVFILAGGIYDLAENPLPMGQTANALVPIFRSS
ncbi:hypothetical protein, partial [Candidatus Hodarchaeum mangrovi]